MVAYRLSSAACMSWLRRRSCRIRPCSLSTTRAIERRRNCATSAGSRSTSAWNSSGPSSNNCPSLPAVASALRVCSPISRPSSPKYSPGPRRLGGWSLPKSSSTWPRAMTYIKAPESPRRKIRSPACIAPARPTAANSPISRADRCAVPPWAASWTLPGPCVTLMASSLDMMRLQSPPPRGKMEHITGPAGLERIPGQREAIAVPRWGVAPSGAGWAPLPLRLVSRANPAGHAPAGDRPQAAALSWNCSSSVEPFSAVVEDWPCWMAWVTVSK